MLLPELTIFISTKTFETNCEYFFHKYVTKHNIPNLSLKKSDIVSSGYRYTIHFGTQESSGSTPTRVGEIDVIPIHDGKIKFQAAVYNFEKLLQPLLFFNEFYNFIFANWEVDPQDKIHGYDDELATSEWISIGCDTGYFYFPEVIKEMDKLLEDNFGKSLSGYLDIQREVVPSLTNSEREEIIQKYQLEINKSLLKSFENKSPTKNNNINVRPKTRRRFQQLKEIKDKNPYLSQVGVVLKFNRNCPEEERIEVYDLQYAYKAMGEKWKNSKDIK